MKWAPLLLDPLPHFCSLLFLSGPHYILPYATLFHKANPWVVRHFETGRVGEVGLLKVERRRFSATLKTSSSHPICFIFCDRADTIFAVAFPITNRLGVPPYIHWSCCQIAMSSLVDASVFVSFYHTWKRKSSIPKWSVIRTTNK